MPRHVAVAIAGLAVGCGAARAVGVGPALVVWQTGITEKEGPSPLVETILPATYAGKETWRVVHRDPDPVRDGGLNAYDLYDVARDDFAPLRSVMVAEGLSLTLTFEGDAVTIDRRDGDVRRERRVQVHDPRPEGPGSMVFVAGLPLRDGYRTSYRIVDRWAGDGEDPVKWVDLSAGGVETLASPLGRCAVREVVLAARDGSFRVRTWVRRDAPHYALRIEYRRGDRVFVSEVVRMVLEGDAPPC